MIYAILHYHYWYIDKPRPLRKILSRDGGMSPLMYASDFLMGIPGPGSITTPNDFKMLLDNASIGLD